MQLLSGRFWLPVEKVFRMMGGLDVRRAEGCRSVDGVLITELRLLLGKFGVILCELGGVRHRVTKGDEIFDLMKNSRAGSVVMFSVEWVEKIGQKTEDVAHTLVAWKDRAGTVYLIDRASESTGRVFRSFAELDDLGYKGIANCVIQNAYRFENCTGGFVREAGRLLFAIGFTTTLAVNAVEAPPEQQTAQQR